MVYQSPGTLRSVFKVIAFAWAWPYAMYAQAAINFGAMALAALVMSLVLWLRDDWKGAVTVMAWSLFAGWLIAAIVGQAQGT